MGTIRRPRRTTRKGRVKRPQTVCLLTSNNANVSVSTEARRAFKNVDEQDVGIADNLVVTRGSLVSPIVITALLYLLQPLKLTCPLNSSPLNSSLLNSNLLNSSLLNSNLLNSSLLNSSLFNSNLLNSNLLNSSLLMANNRLDKIEKLADSNVIEFWDRLVSRNVRTVRSRMQMVDSVRSRADYEPIVGCVISHASTPEQFATTIVEMAMVHRIITTLFIVRVWYH